MGVAARAVNEAHEVPRVERLLKDPEKFRVGPGFPQPTVVAGDGNHGCAMRSLGRSHLVQNVEPAGDRERQVDHDYIRLERLEYTEPRQPIGRRPHMVAVHSERRRKRFPSAVVVFDQQHLGCEEGMR